MSCTYVFYYTIEKKNIDEMSHARFTICDGLAHF